jgi:hypothetical protein
MLTKEQLKNYWAKVGVKGEDECWNWTACRDGDGYGQYGRFNFGNGMSAAHRVSAYIAGLIPSIGSQSDNDQVLHKCDNTKCQNPKHFFIGSNKDNMADKVKKGRQANGVENGMARLTEQDVLEVRRLHAQGGITQTELANIYNVRQPHIARIVNRKSWAHI